MSKSTTEFKPLPKGITALPCPQPSDWKRGDHEGDRCCLFGWAYRALGKDPGGFFEDFHNDPDAYSLGVGVAEEAGVDLSWCQTPMQKVDSAVEAFDGDKSITFKQWSDAWRRYVAKTYGLTRRCKVARPAPL